MAPESSFNEATDIEPAAPVTNHLERLPSRHANETRALFLSKPGPSSSRNPGPLPLETAQFASADRYGDWLAQFGLHKGNPRPIQRRAERGRGGAERIRTQTVAAIDQYSPWV